VLRPAWQFETNKNGLVFPAKDDGPRFAGWPMALAVLGVLLGGFFGGMTRRSIIKPLARARQDIERISSGDLTGLIEISGNDEMPTSRSRSVSCAAVPNRRRRVWKKPPARWKN